MVDRHPPLPSDARDPTTQARQGKTLGSMRWVLAISLVTVVLAFVIAFSVMPMS